MDGSGTPPTGRAAGRAAPPGRPVAAGGRLGARGAAARSPARARTVAGAAAPVPDQAGPARGSAGRRTPPGGGAGKTAARVACAHPLRTVPTAVVRDGRPGTPPAAAAAATPRHPTRSLRAWARRRHRWTVVIGALNGSRGLIPDAKPHSALSRTSQSITGWAAVRLGGGHYGERTAESPGIDWWRATGPSHRQAVPGYPDATGARPGVLR